MYAIVRFLKGSLTNGHKSFSSGGKVHGPGELDGAGRAKVHSSLAKQVQLSRITQQLVTRFTESHCSVRVGLKKCIMKYPMD